ncbi:MAG: OmpA family protein, partial [Phocaeicola sp.]
PVVASNEPEIVTNGKKYSWNEKWYYQIQAGTNYLAAENTRFVNIDKILAPSYAFAVGKRFTPLWGARIQFMGGKDMGVYYERNPESPMFSFRHHGIIAEGTFNFANFLRQNYYVGNEKRWNVDFKLGVGWIHSHSYTFSEEVVNDGSNIAFPTGKFKDNLALYGGVEFSRIIYKNLDLNIELSLAKMGNKYNSQICKDQASEVIGDILAHALIGIRYTIPTRKPCKERIIYINQTEVPTIITAKRKITNQPEATEELIDQTNCHEVDELLSMIEEGKSIRGLKICTIRMIHFDFDKSDIKPEYALYLDKIATLLINQAEAKLLIIGNTDIKGSVDYNWGLSERRAKEVINYLYQKGVTYERMLYRYESKLRPLTENETERGRSVNRRVELKIIP